MCGARSKSRLFDDPREKALRDAVRQAKLFPILYGSATRQVGIQELMDAVVDYLPSPLDEGPVEGKNPVTGEAEKRSQDAAAPFSAYVFKTIIDPFAGKLSIMRVVSGKIASDLACYNPNKQSKEKIGHMFRLEGKKQEAVKEADVIVEGRARKDNLLNEPDPALVALGFQVQETLPSVFEGGTEYLVYRRSKTTENPRAR